MTFIGKGVLQLLKDIFYSDFFSSVFDVKYYLEVNPGGMGEAEVEHHKTPQQQNNLNNSNSFGNQPNSFEKQHNSRITRTTTAAS
jgi:hypothetical protein